jgi:gliding motility-associated-like protein
MGWNSLKMMFLMALMLMVSVSASAQLRASFRMDNFAGDSITAGCQPLVVLFVDSSKFNGNPVSYSSIVSGGAYDSHKWFFGNALNNTSTLRSPSFVYNTSGTYTITLIVSNNGVNFDTVSRQLTIYPQPVVGFTVTQVNGCSPLTVTFTDTSVGSTNCTWSMGDGTVYTNLCTVTHTYTQAPGVNANCFSVTLIATNQFGCQQSLTKSNYVCINPTPKAGFTSDLQAVCDSPFTVQFSDTSQSTSGLAYFWRFNYPNNNPSSTLQNPSHTYPAGTNTYSVSLTVRDTTCNTFDTITKTGYISVSDVQVSFTADKDSFCLGQSVRFTPTIVGAYTNVVWEFGPTNQTSTQLSPNYTYTQAGTWNVRLRVFSANGCEHDTTYLGMVTVFPLPTANFSYSPNPANSCQAPFPVSFTNQSVGATSYTWLFQAPSPLFTTGQQNPTYTYNTPGTYSVSLTARNQFGCQSSITNNNIINIAPTTVDFLVDTPSGCAPLTVNFTDASSSPANNPIIGWSWNFGDPGSAGSNTSSLRNPSHLYSSVGVYSACLTIVTQSGCVGTKCIDVSVGNSPFAAFSVSNLVVCVDEPISFVNSSTGLINQVTWTFGFPGGPSSVANNPLPFAFDEPGTFVINLSVGQNGCRDDTSITVTVLPAKADFDQTISCTAPGNVTFIDLSIGADTWAWQFGDGGTSNLQNPSHTYLMSGLYTVTLTVTNITTGCVHEFEKEIDVSVLNANFAPNRVTGCAPQSITFNNSSTGSGLTYQWNFGDPGPSNSSVQRSPVHVYNNPGVYTVRLIITDVYGCQDTMLMPSVISISSVTAQYTANPRSGCIPSDLSSYPNINFTDLSTTYGTSTITGWNWDFGTTPVTTSSIQNPSKQYTAQGSYDVTLTVTNSLGCSSTITKPNFIAVRQPVADFTSTYNLFCVGQAIEFTNLSLGQSTGTTYSWDFGDPNNPTADTSNLRNPSYTYNDTGAYTVTLVMTDGLLGCKDTLVIPQLISIDVPELSFIANDTFRYCPPHLVNFTNFANFDTVQVESVLWDFGDGSFSTLFQPSYIYNTAGSFTVCLRIKFANGCQDSICYPNYINIGGSVGNITAVPDSGCSPMNVCFNANTDGSAASHIWFYGDNSPWEQGGDSICHLYTEAGLYQPAVLLIDTQVPACQYILTYRDTIVVDTVVAGFYSDVDTVCQNEPVQFTDTSYTIANKPIVAWEWDFGDGSPIDTNQNPTHRFLTSGLINVTLTAYSSYGCMGSIIRQLLVLSRPTAAFDASDTIGCVQLSVLFTDQSVPGDAPINAWFWNFGVIDSTNDTSIVQNPGAYFYADTGQYIASLLVTDGNGCLDTAFQEINVYPNPIGLSNPDTVRVCIYDTLQLLGDTTYAVYDWSPGIWLSDSTIAQPYSVPLDTVDYELITTDIYGCFTVDSIHIIVNPLPTLTVSPYPDTAICEGDTVQLTATSNGIAFLWSPPAGLDNPNSPTPVATPAQTTTYVVYTVDGNACNRTDSVKIVVNRFFTNYLVERVCLGSRTDIVDLSSTSDLPIATWNWDFGNSNATSTLRSPNYTYPDSGNYTVTLILTDIIGCTDTVQQIARVDHPAEPDAWPDTIICYGDAIQLTAVGGDTIYWTPNIDIDDANSFTPTVSPQVTTTYVANITYGVCPFDTANVLVVVNPTPLLGVATDFEILKGDSVILANETWLYDTIFWEPAAGLSCTDCASPLAKPDSTTTYSVTIIDSLGCTNTKFVTVTVVEKCNEDQIFVGNGFTPNGDGVNDLAYARLQGLKRLIIFRIFDRWGNLVFETNDSYTGWDGKNSKGEQLNSGVYVYIVEAECFSGTKLTKTGNVTIIN